MKLHDKILFGLGLVPITTFSRVEIIGFSGMTLHERVGPIHVELKNHLRPVIEKIFVPFERLESRLQIPGWQQRVGSLSHQKDCHRTVWSFHFSRHCYGERQPFWFTDSTSLWYRAGFE